MLFLVVFECADFGVTSTTPSTDPQSIMITTDPAPFTEGRSTNRSRERLDNSGHQSTPSVGVCAATTSAGHWSFG
jgi:hypothetical protein